MGNRFFAAALLFSLLLLADRLHLQLSDLPVDEQRPISLVIRFQMQSYVHISLDFGQFAKEPVGEPGRIISHPQCGDDSVGRSIA